MIENQSEHWILSTHPKFEANYKYWQYYLDHFVGGADYCGKRNPVRIAGGDGNAVKVADNSYGATRYLWQHPLEKDFRFEHRLNRAPYVDIISPVVNFYAGAIAKNVQIGADPDFADFLDDADMRGNSLAQCLTEARTNAQIFGHTFILIDSTSANADEIRTEADAKRLGVRPFWREITPLHFRNWRCDDRTGRITEAIFEVFPEDGESIGSARTYSSAREFFYWTDQKWERYRVTASEGRNNTALIDSGKNMIGRVPIRPFFYERCMRDGSLGSESLLKNSSKYGQLLTNWLAGGDEAIENQMFAVAVLTSNDPPAELGVGNTSVIHLNPNKQEDFKYISPDTAPFESLWTAFFRVWAMANVQMGVEAPNISDTPENKSGISKQWDYVKTDKILARMAQNEQEAVKDVMYLAGLWKDPGGKRAYKGQVQYPMEFDTRTLEQDINGIVQAQAANIPPAALRELRRKYIAKALPSVTPDVAKEIDNELGAPPAEPFKLPDQVGV